ncbi:MAG: hypothetical protein RSB59_02945, partial [Clostridia bacterium]
STEEDNLVNSKVFFTSEKTAQGRVRVFAEIFYDSRWRDVRATILLVPTIKNEIEDMAIIKALVDEGYVVCWLDYCGNFKENINHTSYPAEYPYAVSPECYKFLNTIETDARNTPWFQWVKVVRRTISMLSEHRLVDKDRIGVIGIGTGAQIAWQTAGIDGRVRALVPVNGGGYLWMDKTAGMSVAIPSTDLERAFSTGVGAETYARFVTCPTCFLVSSNSSYCSVDRAGDILASVPARCKQLLISPGTDSQITQKSFASVLLWLRNNFALDGEEAPKPVLQFEEIEGKLYLRLNTDKKADEKTVYINYGEQYSGVRYWEEQGSAQKTNTHEYTYAVPLADVNVPVFAYATMKYLSGIMVSTPISSVMPSKIGVLTADKQQVLKGNLVYNGSMGLSSFFASTKKTLLDENILSVKTGPFDIAGISVEDGDLGLYKRTRGGFPDDCEMLQFDAYSKTEKTITLKFFTYPELKYYVTTVDLKGGEFWQKVLLSCSDFKSDSGRALQKFSDAKMFIFSFAKQVVFNNLLWI